MAKNDKDLKIGISTEYDGSGAQAALADAEKVKQANAAAASVPKSGGSSAAGVPQSGGQVDTSGEEALAKARENTTAATGKATEASKALSAARTDGQKATTTAATAEKTLATERKATADATTTAADAEQKAAAEATAAVQQKQQASAQNTEALSKEQQEIEALKAQMALEAKGRAGLIKELERLGKARARAAKAGDVQAFKQLEAQMTKTRQAFERMNQGLEISRLGMMGQMQTAMGAMSAIQSLGNECKNGSVSIMGVTNAVYALGAAVKAGLGPWGALLIAIQAATAAWDWWQSRKEEKEKAAQERMKKELDLWKFHNDQLRKFTELYSRDLVAGKQKELERIQEEWDKFTQQTTAQQQRADVVAAAAEERRRIAAQSAYNAELARVELAKTLGEITEADAIKRKASAEEEMARTLLLIDEEERQRTQARHAGAQQRAEAEAQAMEKALAEQFGKFDEVLKIELPRKEEWEALQIKFERGLATKAEQAKVSAFYSTFNDLIRTLQMMGIEWHGSYEELIPWVESLRQAREAGELRVRELHMVAEAEKTAAEESVLEIETRKQQAQADKEQREAALKQEAARLQQQEAANKLTEEWQAVQRGTLEEQAEWLEQTAASFAAGSAEAKKWEEALRGVKLKQVATELNSLGDTFKVTGNYAAKDNRTQAQIFAADEKALRQRREALERMRRTPGLDAATMRAINAKIKETDRQARRLRQNLKESADAAQRSVAALKPLGQKARTSTMQTALKRSENAFVRLAKQAERQASKGDTKGMERSLAAMRRHAAQQERLTGYTGRAAGHMRNVEGKLRLVAKGTAAQDRGLTAQQRQHNKVLQALGMQRRYTARQAAAAGKAAKAKEKEAQANDRAAKAATRDTRKAKPKTQARQIQELTNKLQEANKSLAEQKAEVVRLNTAIQELASAAREGAAAARGCASAAASAVAGLRREVKALQRAVERLRKK